MIINSVKPIIKLLNGRNSIDLDVLALINLGLVVVTLNIEKNEYEKFER